jgi:hypothetical protein
VATLDPTVRSEMLGLYQVQYAATGWLTPVEEAVLRPYRRPRTGSPTIGGPSSDAYAERAAASPWSELTDAGWWL